MNHPLVLIALALALGLALAALTRKLAPSARTTLLLTLGPTLGVVLTFVFC